MVSELNKKSSAGKGTSVPKGIKRQPASKTIGKQTDQTLSSADAKLFEKIVTRRDDGAAPEQKKAPRRRRPAAKPPEAIDAPAVKNNNTNNDL